MSTGDQTEYMRGKQAERGVGQNVRFSQDGFDRWAQSSQPAREGQMEKIPAEVQMPSSGGSMAMTVYDAQRLARRRNRGGTAFDDIKRKVDQIKLQVKSILDIYRKISKFVDDFQQDLKDEIIENPAMASKPSLLNFATKLNAWIGSLKVYKDMFDKVAAAAEAYGMGRRGVRRGGISTEQLMEYGKKIFEVFMFIKNNIPNLELILKFKSLQPIGGQILAALQPVINMLRGPKVGAGQSCMCEDKPRRVRGGAQVGFTGGEMVQMSRIDGNDDVFYRNGHAMAMAPARPQQSTVSEQIMPAEPPSADDLLRRKLRAEAFAKWKESSKVGGRSCGGRVGDPTTDRQKLRLDQYARQRESARLGRRYGGRADAPMTRQEKADALAKAEALAKVGGFFWGKDPFHEFKPTRAQIEAAEAMKNSEVNNWAHDFERRTKDDIEKVRKQIEGKGRKPSTRGAIVKKVMAEHGLSLPQASKYVKENGLY